MDEKRAKALEEEWEKLTPEQREKILYPMQELLGQMKKSMARYDEFNKQLTEAFNDHNTNISNAMQSLTAIVEAARETHKDLQKLGASSFTEGISLFPDTTKGAFIHILNLARRHIEAGLLLKDYAEAINPDYTVKEAFLFKGELEQALADAKDDIAEYLAELKEEKKILSRADKLRVAKEAREKAVAIGAITTINNHLAAPSAKEIAQIFTPDNIYLLKSPELFDEGGRLQEQEGKQADIQRVDEVQTQFLMLLFRMVCMYYDPTSPDRPDDKITFSIPRMLEELGLDARKGSAAKLTNASDKEKRLRRILDLIEPSTDKVIRLPKGTEYYRICSVSMIDREAEIISLDVPYFFRLFEYIEQQKYKDRAINQLFHSTIANESNTAAIELAARILAGVKQRGLNKDNAALGIGVIPKKITTRTKDSKGNTVTKTVVFDNSQTLPTDTPEEKRITYRIRWETLILDCPQLLAKLNAVMEGNSTNKAALFNNILRDTIGAACRLIMEKSDAPKYYLDFKIEPLDSWGKVIPPTKTQLKKYMTVSHKGKNKNFVQTE